MEQYDNLSHLTLAATQSLRQDMGDIEYRRSNDIMTLGLIILLILAVFIAIDQMAKREISALREEMQRKSGPKQMGGLDEDVRAELKELRDQIRVVARVVKRDCRRDS